MMIQLFINNYLSLSNFVIIKEACDRNFHLARNPLLFMPGRHSV